MASRGTALAGVLSPARLRALVAARFVRPSNDDAAAPRRPIRSPLTRSGWAVAGTSLAVAMAAANTANNLLYLLLGLMLAAYPISAMLARGMVRRVSGELLPPREARAGADVDVAAVVRGEGVGAAGILLDLVVVDPRRRAGVVASSSAVAALGRGVRETVRLSMSPARRGRVVLRLRARSPFPFGLFEAERVLAEAEMLALPLADPTWRTALARATAEEGAQPRRGQGSEIFDIRDWRLGDDARHIDWKATARLDRPMVREHALDQEKCVTLVLDPARDPAIGAADPDAPVEHAISLVAGAVDDLASDGWRLRLLAPALDVSGEPLVLLRALALLEPTDSPWGEGWRAWLQDGESAIVFRAGSRPRAVGGIAGSAGSSS